MNITEEQPQVGNNLIQIATAEIGTVESPPGSNHNKYGKWFGLDGVAWCGQFVSWVYHTAGMALGNIGYLKGFAGCDTAVANIHKWGVRVLKPEPGDVVFFDWERNGKWDHTGIFVKDLGNGLFESIEGNTSLANDSNGGSVMRRQRRYTVAMFVRPNSKK